MNLLDAVLRILPESPQKVQCTVLNQLWRARFLYISHSDQSPEPEKRMHNTCIKETAGVISAFLTSRMSHCRSLHQTLCAAALSPVSLRESLSRFAAAAPPCALALHCHPPLFFPFCASAAHLTAPSSAVPLLSQFLMSFGVSPRSHF